MTPWLDHRVLVTVGTGGVGKTTVAAALGLEGARQGKRVLVVTIDPAKRLAQALGMEGLGHEARAIPPELLHAVGIEGRGTFAAMMLDTKRTFDEVVSRYAPDEQALERILANPIYRNLTDALAGSREYSAMEKLHQLHTTGEYDLIVLDTPPSGHALDFLDAPRRLTGFLESQILRLMFRPALLMGRTGIRLFRFGSTPLLRAMEHVSGIEFLTAVSEFLLAFESMLDGFTSRSREIEALLRNPICGFLLVVGPEREQARRAREFWHRLEQEHVNLVGLIVNRMRSWPGPDPIPEFGSAESAKLADWLAETLTPIASAEASEPIVRGLTETLTRQAALAYRDRTICETLAQQLTLRPEAVRRIPLFDEDVHALESLAQMSSHLFKDNSNVQA
jgi:anion-transporting  ArsA/GET3 family ATPase